MPSIRTTDVFDHWFVRIRDLRARVRVQARIDRLAMGNPGYRVYYTQRGSILVVLLCGGDKSSQRDDIAQAKDLAANLDME